MIAIKAVKQRWQSLLFTGLSSFFISQAFANTTANNIYDTEGKLVASCTETSCSYVIYEGLSQVGSMYNGKFNRFHQGPGGKIARTESDSTQTKITFLVPDFHGSNVAAISDETTEQHIMDAFGCVLQDSTENITRPIYTDKHELENAKGIYNFNARFYDCVLGRFLTTDPVAPQAPLNWYIYVNNSPLAHTDPTGKCFDTTTGMMDCFSLAADLDAVSRNPSWKNYAILGYDAFAAIPGNPLPSIGVFAHGGAAVANYGGEILAAAPVINARIGKYLDDSTEFVDDYIRGGKNNVQTIRQGSKAITTNDGYKTLQLIVDNNGAAPSGYVGAITFKNRGAKLPEYTPEGNIISYKEYDIYPSNGGRRGTQRIIVGTTEDGYLRAYQTNAHYESFAEM